jgi:hypothetical protein
MANLAFRAPRNSVIGRRPPRAEGTVWLELHPDLREQARKERLVQPRSFV